MSSKYEFFIDKSSMEMSSGSEMCCTDEGYSRKASCALNLIFTLLLYSSFSDLYISILYLDLYLQYMLITFFESYSMSPFFNLVFGCVLYREKTSYRLKSP